MFLRLRLRLFLLSAALCILSCSATNKSSDKKPEVEKKSDAIPVHFKGITFPPFTYSPPHPSDYIVELTGGHIAYLVKDSSLDLIKINFMFESENFPRKKNEVALHSLYSSLLYSGGTKEFTPMQLEDSLEFIAAGISATLGHHTSNLSIDALSGDGLALLNLLAKVALEPRFYKNILKLHKKKINEAIQHRYDRPRTLLSLAYEHVNFGSHPHNWLATEKEVKAISRTKLKKIIGLGFAPKRIVISVAGNFEKEIMIRALNEFIEKFALLAPPPKGSWR